MRFLENLNFAIHRVSSTINEHEEEEEEEEEETEDEICTNNIEFLCNSNIVNERLPKNDIFFFKKKKN